MFYWVQDFEDRLNKLSRDLAEDVVGLLEGLLRDPELIYAQDAFVWTRRDDVGPRAIQIVIKDAAADNVTIVVRFENGAMAGLFVKEGTHLTPDDVAIARANYIETQEAIDARPSTWKRGS